MGEQPIYLAFRVFGDFHWPPVRSDFDVATDDSGKTLQKGVVEIYYSAPVPGNPNNLAAYLRWTAWKDGDRATPVQLTGDLGPTVDIQASNDDLTNAFKENSALFRLTGTAPQAGKARRLL